MYTNSLRFEKKRKNRKKSIDCNSWLTVSLPIEKLVLQVPIFVDAERIASKRSKHIKGSLEHYLLYVLINRILMTLLCVWVWFQNASSHSCLEKKFSGSETYYFGVRWWWWWWWWWWWFSFLFSSLELFTIQYNTIQLYCLCVEKFAFAFELHMCNKSQLKQDACRLTSNN